MVPQDPRTDGSENADSVASETPATSAPVSAEATDAETTDADVIDEAEETDDDGPKRSTGKSIALFFRDVLFILVAAILISFLIKTFLIRTFYIPSGSMETTLLENDRIIVNQLTPDLMPLEHGDVIVFTDPGGWLPPTTDPVLPPAQQAVETALSFVGLTAPDSNDHLVKRVIGMPGDHVVCCDEFGQLTVNGIPLDEPYITLPDADSNASPTDFDVVVPEGYLWVMGDNRYQSADSADHHAREPGHEFVPIDNVVGRALVVSWPVSRWASLDNYPAVFDGVEEAQKTDGADK
jgi:signal peptidase I